MRILQLCKKFPFPLKDGEAIAVTYLAQAMHRLGHEVTLLAMNTTKHPVRVSKVRHELKHYEKVFHTSLDNEVKPLHAFLNLFSSDSYNISRFDNAAFRRKLSSLLRKKKYDVIQLESLYLAPYIEVIRQLSEAKVVLRAHNVEHEIWERMSVNEPVALRRWYLEYSARKLRKYEVEQLANVDCLLPISAIDAAKFRKLGYQGPSTTVPIGVNVNEFTFKKIEESKALSVSFIGSLDWMPNVEALNWFLDQVWPHLNTLFPQLVLHIAGRNCPEWLQQLQMKNVIVEGEVENSEHFLHQHALTVVPILSGSGMRAKIIEAMALGRIVLTTSVGLEGIGATDECEVLVANTAQEFISKFSYCHKEGKKLAEIGLRARKLVEQDFDHLKIGRLVEDSYVNSLHKPV